MDYKTNPVFKAFEVPCLEFEKKLLTIHLPPEKVFGECFRIIDSFKNDPEDTRRLLAKLWNEVFCRLRRDDNEKPETEDLTLATCVIMYQAALCFMMAGGLRNMHIYNSILGILEDKCPDITVHIASHFILAIPQEVSNVLSEYMSAYLASSKTISEECLCGDTADLTKLKFDQAIRVAQELLQKLQDSGFAATDVSLPRAFADVFTRECDTTEEYLRDKLKRDLIEFNTKFSVGSLKLYPFLACVGYMISLGAIKDAPMELVRTMLPESKSQGTLRTYIQKGKNGAIRIPKKLFESVLL